MFGSYPFGAASFGASSDSSQVQQPTQAPTQPPAQTGSITVPASRTASFEGRSRVVVFNGTKPVRVQKSALDELYVVGYFTKDLSEAATTASSVAPVSGGVAVLEGPVLQGGYGVVKLGALDMAAPRRFFTFRVTCVNGEQFDRTVELEAVDDRSQVFGKDPDDKRLYAFDFGQDATFGGAALASVGSPAAVGVTALSLPVIQGNKAILMIGGLDVADGATNSVTLTANFANSEKVTRAMYFTLENH